jgi:hypothetical protein
VTDPVAGFTSHNAIVLAATSTWLLSTEDGEADLPLLHQPLPLSPGPVAWTDPDGPGPRTRHGEFLRGILTTDIGAPGWISLDHEAPRWTPAGPVAGKVVGQLERRMRDVFQQVRANAAMPDDRKARLLEGLRHRMYLDSRRAAAVCGTNAPEIPHGLMVDLRFFHLLNQLRCHLSVSVWSRPPRNHRYAPAELADPAVAPTDHPVAEYQAAFEVAAAAFNRLLRGHFTPVEFRVFGRAYRPPVFWVVVPLEPEADPLRYLKGSRPLADDLARRLLNVGHPRDCVVAESVLNGEMLALRRMRRTRLGAPAGFARVWADPDTPDVPYYLILPGAPGPGRDAAALEEHTGTVIELLTDLEAEAAHRLYEVQADLEIWSNHLKVYNAVVERGAMLWDALSTHLPIRRRTKLGRVHRTVELQHQFLLQAIADLGQIAALTRLRLAEIRIAADELQDDYNLTITERHAPRRPGLRAALTETGLFEDVKRHGDEVVRETERVQAAYDDLIRTISSAFDERRVRESDVLQKAGTWLSISVALVGVVTILDVTVDLKSGPGARVAEWLGGADTFAWLSLALGAVQILVLLWAVAWWVGRVGVLGSSVFRDLYDGRRLRRWLHRSLNRLSSVRSGRLGRWLARPYGSVWQFLKDTSTDSLERVARDEATDWDRYDRRYAGELARLWDDASPTGRWQRDDRVGRDIRGLAHQIEYWGLHALLITERARRMWRYRLPSLTCLYSCCDRIEGSFLGASYLPAVSIVAGVDFTRTLERIGFTWAQASEILAWLTARRFPTAADALAEIDRLGLAAQMDDRQRARTLAVIHGRLP